MKFSKIFGVFKKGAKAAGKKGKKGEVARFGWPSGTRIGVFGHENSGKTVYFTVLNEDCKIAKNLQISVTDNATAGEFLSNFRNLWGLGTSDGTGTVVDSRGEKNFPDPTGSDKVLQFTAILDRGKKMAVVTYDYNGKAVSISGTNDLAEKVIDFMTGCAGLMFFFDPKILGSELQVQAHVASFVNMLERLAPLESRMPIPIALVINKADILPGFSGDDQVVLVNPEDEHFISDDFEIFLEKVLSSNKIAANSVWAGSVRNILVKLREFLRVVVGRTLDFQVFFVSNTGTSPEKVGADVGRSIYKPPAKINPIGVREPFYWLLHSVVRNKRIGLFKKVTRYVVTASIIWILFYSLPFIYHFSFLMSKPVEVENNILKQYGGNQLSTTDGDRMTIMREYDRYNNRWLVKKMFPDFQLPSKKIYETYKHFNIGAAVGRLDNLIGEFTRIVADSTAWPAFNPNTGELNLNDRHKALLAALDSLHTGEATSVLYVRAGRTKVAWELFAGFLSKRQDLEAARRIQDQVLFDKNNAEDYGAEEERLGQALLNVAKVKEEKVVRKADSEQALTQYNELKDRINNSNEPAFLFGKAVSDLKKILGKLGADDIAEKQAIQKYLREIDKWNEPHSYTYKIVSIPDAGHVHVDVAANGQEPTWADSTQLFEGEELKIKWKIDEDIYIGYDTPGAPEYWGRTTVGKVVLKGKYDLFAMDGSVEFKDIGKTVIFSFKPSLQGMLPRLEE
nr:hypothetical protein [candidate division Zixibacteria bacterium]